MKYLSIIILSFGLLLSCKKPKDRVEKREDENSKLTVKEHFAVVTNVSSWKNYKEKRVDDSTKFVSGDFNNYYITGFLDSKGKKKDWWNITDKNNDKSVKLLYEIIENNEEISQYIYYNSKEIDKTKSKFYEKKKIGSDTYRMIFYTPIGFTKINQQGDFGYYLNCDNEKKGVINVKCDMEKGYYYTDIKNIEKCSKINIIGAFFELYQDGDGNFVENMIYVKESLK